MFTLFTNMTSKSKKALLNFDIMLTTHFKKWHFEIFCDLKDQDPCDIYLIYAF